MRFKVFQQKTARAHGGLDAEPTALRPARAFAPPAPSPQRPRATAPGADAATRGHSFGRLGGGHAPGRSAVGGTVLPGRLRKNVERLSGVSLEDVRVHRNSNAPARLGALAHTRGPEIHLAPGQERHLPHEAWHVAQQKLGVVRPTAQLNGAALNDNAGLEREADLMGARAAGVAPPAGAAARPAGTFPQLFPTLTGGAFGAAAARPVVQRMYSGSESEREDEDDDPSYFEKEKREGAKKTDPKSSMKKGSRTGTDDAFEYETEGGAQHKEQYDQKTLTRTTSTTGLQVSGPQFRNNAARDKGIFTVHNPYGLSMGQSSLNQMVLSHNSPSWLGMRAGKQYGNSALTSPTFNSEVEKKEKKMREDIESSSLVGPFKYETTTKEESIADNMRAEEIAKMMKNPRWQEKERIIARMRKVLAQRKDAKRVVEEQRTLTDAKSKKRTFKMAEPDLHAFIPRRAYDLEAHKKYVEARGQDSEGSDAELEPPLRKKLKKNPKKKKKDPNNNNK